MENIDKDIKIVEEQLNTYKRHLKNYEKDDCLTSVYYELKKYAQSLENLLSRLKTAERMNDVLVERIDIYDYDEQCFYNQDCKKCIGNKEKSCNKCIKEWARKKVEDEL